MRYFPLSLLIIVSFLLFVAPLALTGCGGGISSEQRESYLKLAENYESKAQVQQTLAQDYRNNAARLPHFERYNDSRRSYEVLAKQCDDLANEYRQQALKYRELATK